MSKRCVMGCIRIQIKYEAINIVSINFEIEIA